MDSQLLASLRIEESLKRLHQGDPIASVVELEELLDADPNNPEALYLLGQSNLISENPLAAFYALQHCTQIAPEECEAHVSLAIASFEICSFARCLKAANTAISIDMGHAMAWRLKGLTLERLGKPLSANRALLRAFELEPKTHPLPEVINEEQWEHCYRLAMESLPSSDAHFLDNCEIIWTDLPTEDMLFSSFPPQPPLQSARLDGMNEDHPKLYLFKGNLKYNYSPRLPLSLRIKEALIDELLRKRS
jgi:tetratricopeptide (TPR) repeat protein